MDESHSPLPPTKEAFHLARSAMLDSFAALEVALMYASKKAEIIDNAVHFAQVLDQMRKSKFFANLLPNTHSELNELLDRCHAISLMRNDIVHSRMHFLAPQGNMRACFSNSRECFSEHHMARIFTLPGLVALSKQTRATAQRLDAIFNQQPLPQQPSPDAAAGL